MLFWHYQLQMWILFLILQLNKIDLSSPSISLMHTYKCKNMTHFQESQSCGQKKNYSSFPSICILSSEVRKCFVGFAFMYHWSAFMYHCTAVDCTINRNCIHICGLEPKIEITFTNNYTQCILYHDYFCHSCSIYWKISTFIFSSEIQLALTSSYYFFKMPFIAIDIDIPLLWFGSASKFLQTKHWNFLPAAS